MGRRKPQETSKAPELAELHLVLDQILASPNKVQKVMFEYELGVQLIVSFT